MRAICFILLAEEVAAIQLFLKIGMAIQLIPGLILMVLQVCHIYFQVQMEVLRIHYYTIHVDLITPLWIQGCGGKVVIYNWDGDVLYTYNIDSNDYNHHHDIAVLPNGNFIVIAWERLYSNEWQALGRQNVNNNLNQMWMTAFFEIQPTLDGRTESIDNFDSVVWEWHIKDHLIQDVDLH